MIVNTVSCDINNNKIKTKTYQHIFGRYVEKCKDCFMVQITLYL